MKKLFTLMSLCVFTLVSVTGCNDATQDGHVAAPPASDVRAPEAAPPAADLRAPASVPPAAEQPVAGEAEHTFSLSVPFEPVALTQGEAKSIRIGINRGENFGEEVEISVSGLPMGVTVETMDPVITQGSTGVELTLRAANDAALGDFTAKVTGHTASSSADFSEEFKITVSQR